MIKVNGQIIPDEAIDFELARLIKLYSEHISRDQIEQQMDLLRSKAKEQAIGAKLLIEEAERLDLRVSSERIEMKIKELVESAGGEEAFRDKTERQGISMEQLREGVERGAKVDLLVDRITEGIADPTEAEILDHYKAHAGEYTVPDSARVSHILIKPLSSSESDRNTAKSRLMEIRAEIEDSKDFAEQAAAFSECPSGRKTGGSLGWISRGMTVGDLDRVIFSLGVGELSEVVETPLGFHILKKTDERAGGQAEFGDVKEKAREFLRHARRGEAIAAYVAELRKKAVIEDT